MESHMPLLSLASLKRSSLIISAFFCTYNEKGDIKWRFSQWFQTVKSFQHPQSVTCWRAFYCILNTAQCYEKSNILCKHLGNILTLTLMILLWKLFSKTMTSPASAGESVPSCLKGWIKSKKVITESETQWLWNLDNRSAAS